MSSASRSRLESMKNNTQAPVFFKKKCCIPTLQIDIFIEKIHGCKIQDMSMSFSNFFNHDWPNSTYISYITLPLFENPINRLQSSFLSHGGIVEMNQNDLNSPKHEK